MNNNNLGSRRRFLATAGVLTASKMLKLGTPALGALAQAACSARDAGEKFVVLTTTEAADFEAIAARIIPTTDTPGAREAGVIHFFDKAFACEMQGMLPDARHGLAELNTSVDDAASFAALPPEVQDRYLRNVEGGAFFKLMWKMTIYGFFAMSDYGGNRDLVGWKLVGFEGHHGGWQHPFGFYDADANGTQPDGE